MSIQAFQQWQQQQAQPQIDPVSRIQKSRNVPSEYSGGWVNRTATPGPQTSMTGLAEWMGNGYMPTRYFGGQSPQRWQPSQSPMAGMNGTSWLDNYLASIRD